MLLFFANFILCIHFSHRFLLSALDGQVFTMSPKLGSRLSFPCAGNMGGRHRIWFSHLKWFFSLLTWYKPSDRITLSNLLVTVSPHSQRKCSFSLTSGYGRRIEVRIFLCSHCRETHFWWICMFIVSTLEKVTLGKSAYIWEGGSKRGRPELSCSSLPAQAQTGSGHARWGWRNAEGSEWELFIVVFSVIFSSENDYSAIGKKPLWARSV